MSERQRYILGIETSNPSAWIPGTVKPGVAIARTGVAGLEIVGIESVDPAGTHDDGLMPAIDRVVKGAGLRPRDIGCVAVSIGPGGFTAVRLAVTTAKLIAEATGAQCKGVPSAWVAAARVKADGPFAVALASKNDSTWVTVFDADGKETQAGRLMTAADMPRVGLLIADQFVPEPIQVAALGMGMEVRPPVFDAVACIEVSERVEGVDPAMLLPIYPREAEAVRKWRELHGTK